MTAIVGIVAIVLLVIILIQRLDIIALYKALGAKEEFLLKAERELLQCKTKNAISKVALRNIAGQSEKELLVKQVAKLALERMEKHG